MNEITHTLNRIRETSSSNEKLAILKETQSDLFASIFSHAYDHFKKYGVSKLDLESIEYTTVQADDKWYNDMFLLLAALQQRTVTGNAARDSVTAHMSKVCKEDAEIFAFILKKDLRIGAGVGLINKVYKDLLPEAFCMAANKYDAKRVTFPVWADTKLDGVRCIAVVESPTDIVLYSRNGREFKNYTHIEDSLKKLNLPVGTRLDGEVTMGHFQNLMRTLSRKDDGVEMAQDAMYNVFDFQVENMTLTERYGTLLYDLSMHIHTLGLTNVKAIDGQWCDDEEMLLNYYEEMLKLGHEGIMVKSGDGLYEYKRGWGWQKMKPEQTDDLKIVGYEEGRGKYEGKLGAIVCELENGETVHVGSGFEDDEREQYWNDRDHLIGQVAEVKYQEKTREGSLRFPIFIRFRKDKQ